MTNKLAKLIRGISIPPIVVSILVIVLHFTHTIPSIKEGLLICLFLGLIPLLAYPFSQLVKPIKLKGREGMRTTAFVFSIIGYSAGLIYALTTKQDHNLLVLYITYFISVLILTFINSVLKIRASGHMTSITGPLVALVYFLGFVSVIPCLVFYALVFWSSLHLKRHTKQEMILGTLTVLISFGLTLLILFIF